MAKALEVGVLEGRRRAPRAVNQLLPGCWLTASAGHFELSGTTGCVGVSPTYRGARAAIIVVAGASHCDQFGRAVPYGLGFFCLSTCFSHGICSSR